MFKLMESIHQHAELSHARSGGPGGQHVNKTSTKIVLALPIEKLEGLNEVEFARLRIQLANRINSEDKLIIHSSEDRSQKRNIEEAFSRAEKFITTAVRVPKYRKPTKPSKAAKEKRLSTKRAHSAKKAQRNFSSEE
ncbi:MAG: aminoacyl-tRNA hydrolase [Treponema sp.]|jgi:ribosome-associated protein|nr:aminoacyl-tRNA hydrolase [Treponema sp.]